MTKNIANNSSCYICGMRIDRTSYPEAVDKAVDLSRRNGGFICIGALHVLLEANRDEQFSEIVNSAELVTADGISLLAASKLLGIKNAQRVSGPVLTPLICERAGELGIPVGFYGGDEKTLKLLVGKLERQYPSLKIVYAFSPPFRPLTEEEDEKIIEDIIASGAKILFVGIGCPRQEIWIYEHKDKIPIAMISVGAAFNFISGTVKRAPRWMQKIGIEWLFRLTQEPQRLWRRYLIGNAVFIYLLIKELIKSKILKHKYQISKS